MVHEGCNCFSFWAIFCSFTPLTAQKIKISKKWNKKLEISSFYTSVPKLMIICYTVPEIWCVMDVTFIFHFGPFFALLLPITAQKMKISKKWKKRPGDIIILHNCTKNYDYKLYCFWDMACDGCNCSFSFWAIFCPFTPLTARKMKISKKRKKKNEEISSFYTSVPKIMIICYIVPEI